MTMTARCEVRRIGWKALDLLGARFFVLRLEENWRYQQQVSCFLEEFLFVMSIRVLFVFFVFYDVLFSLWRRSLWILLELPPMAFNLRSGMFPDPRVL